MQWNDECASAFPGHEEAWSTDVKSDQAWSEAFYSSAGWSEYSQGQRSFETRGQGSGARRMERRKWQAAEKRAKTDQAEAEVCVAKQASELAEMRQTVAAYDTGSAQMRLASQAEYRLAADELNQSKAEYRKVQEECEEARATIAHLHHVTMCVKEKLEANQAKLREEHAHIGGLEQEACLGVADVFRSHPSSASSLAEMWQACIDTDLREALACAVDK